MDYLIAWSTWWDSVSTEGIPEALVLALMATLIQETWHHCLCFESTAELRQGKSIVALDESVTAVKHSYLREYITPFTWICCQCTVSQLDLCTMVYEVFLFSQFQWSRPLLFSHKVSNSQRLLAFISCLSSLLRSLSAASADKTFNKLLTLLEKETSLL